MDASLPAFNIVIDPSRAGTIVSEKLDEPRAVDVVIDGSRITATIASDNAISLLRDLAYAIADLASSRRPRATVQFYDARDAWSLGLERVGEEVLVSVFQGGTAGHVPVHSRPIKGPVLVQAVGSAIDKTLDRANHSRCPADLQAARAFLTRNPWKSTSAVTRLIDAKVACPDDAPFGFSATFSLRVHSNEPCQDEVQRSDLLALLFRGPVHVHANGAKRNLGEHHLFLLAEALLSQTTKLVDAWNSGLSWHHRQSVAGLNVGLRLTDTDNLDVSFSTRAHRDNPGAYTFPSVSVPDYVQAVLSLCHGIVRPVLRYDRNHGNNLRVQSLRQTIHQLTQLLQRSADQASHINHHPESYEAFAASQSTNGPASHSGASWTQSKVRFHPIWNAVVPGVDLRSVLLYQDCLIAAGSRELACIDRKEGRLNWSTAIGRGVTAPAPSGVVRLAPDGWLTLHDLSTGELTLKTHVTPRSTGTPAVVVINDPGLPKLVVLSEGQRHLSAVDYVCGEVRWRHGFDPAGSFKVRRAGKLLLVSCASPNLSAVDIASGELVWKLRNPAKFLKPVAYQGNDLYVVAGQASNCGRGAQTLLAVDPWSGAMKWQQALGVDYKNLGAPLIHDGLVVLDQADHRGRGFAAFHRDDGSPSWQIEPGFAPHQSAWTVTGSTLVVNCDNGMIAGIELTTGDVVWRRVLEAPQPGDTPRSLEPVAKAGLLFVPQCNVVAVRPQDGHTLGQVEADLVPDVFRVSSDCGVYVVEESGHIAAFEAGARLTLVKS